MKRKVFINYKLCLKEKILITGGTGSFGSYVLKHLLNHDIDEVRIFSRDEKKQHDFRMKYRQIKLNII